MSYGKASPWKSLLSALLEAGAKEGQVFLCEIAPGKLETGMSEFDFGFWAYDNSGVRVSYRAQVKPPPVIWRVVESPCFTGYAMPWDDEQSLAGDLLQPGG